MGDAERGGRMGGMDRMGGAERVGRMGGVDGKTGSYELFCHFHRF